MATNHEFFPNYSEEPAENSTDIEAWYPGKSSELGRSLESMVIYDKASYDVYITRVLQGVSERLGDSGFPTVCCILASERDGIIKKETVVNFFSAVLGL